jgi:DnaK suppressor protein
VNIERFKQRLRDKERELLPVVARLGGEARVSGEAEVRDTSDNAISSQGASLALREEELASQHLVEVQDALRRIETHTYGRCLLCGGNIEGARLEANPGAAYCLEDQQKQEHLPQGGSTL